VRVEAIHGDKSQGARERALFAFKKGTIRVLVATDIAARGLDIVDLSHVVNYDLPNEPEAYVTGSAAPDGPARRVPRSPSAASRNARCSPTSSA